MRPLPVLRCEVADLSLQRTFERFFQRCGWKLLSREAVDREPAAHLLLKMTGDASASLDPASDRGCLGVISLGSGEMKPSADLKPELSPRLPIRLAALREEVEALWRRLSADRPRRIAADFYYDPRSRQLRGAGIRELTAKEGDLLLALIGADKAISREALLKEVWGYSRDLETHTLETHVYRLRQKLDEAGGGSMALLLEEGAYRLALRDDKPDFIR